MCTSASTVAAMAHTSAAAVYAADAHSIGAPRRGRHQPSLLLPVPPPAARAQQLGEAGAGPVRGRRRRPRRVLWPLARLGAGGWVGEEERERG